MYNPNRVNFIINAFEVNVLNNRVETKEAVKEFKRTFNNLVLQNNLPADEVNFVFRLLGIENTDSCRLTVGLKIEAFRHVYSYAVRAVENGMQESELKRRINLLTKNDENAKGIKKYVDEAIFGLSRSSIAPKNTRLTSFDMLDKQSAGYYVMTHGGNNDILKYRKPAKPKGHHPVTFKLSNGIGVWRNNRFKGFDSSWLQLDKGIFNNCNIAIEYDRRKRLLADFLKYIKTYNLGHKIYFGFKDIAGIRVIVSYGDSCRGPIKSVIPIDSQDIKTYLDNLADADIVYGVYSDPCKGATYYSIESIISMIDKRLDELYNKCIVE